MDDRVIAILEEVAEGGDLASNGSRMIRPELANEARELLDNLNGRNEINQGRFTAELDKRGVTAVERLLWRILFWLAPKRRGE